nr:MAG TPA: ribonuclease [Caudoviricetes sp.]
MKKMMVLVTLVMITMLLGNGAYAHQNYVPDFEKICKNGSLESFNEFISALGGPDAPLNGNNDRPLLIAAKLNMFGIVRMLCDMGADVNLHNTYNYTPLMYAAANRNVKMITYLIDRGADATPHGGEKEDPILRLMYTILYLPDKSKMSFDLPNGDVDDYGTFKILIECGASVYDMNDDGDNLLHLAVRSHRALNSYINFYEMIKQLDPNGFKLALTSKNERGKSPLDFAMEPYVPQEAKDYLNRMAGQTKLNAYD